MPYDLTHLNEYLQVDTHPVEVVQLLRHCKYALVCCAAYTENYTRLCDHYTSLLQLEEQFLGLDEELSKIQIRWK